MLYQLFRQSVCTVLASKSGINTLAKSVQQLLDSSLQSLKALQSKETVAVFIQFMDSVGNIITDKKLDTLSGCWVYIRVSITDIHTDVGYTAVAVGDTFLYTALPTTPINTTAANKIVSFDTPTLKDNVVYGDKYCLTHAIPYVCQSATANNDLISYYSQQLLGKIKEPNM